MNWCASGHPQPTLSWSHSDLSPRDLYTRVKVTESQAVLALGPVTRDMAGVYTCTGNNCLFHETTHIDSKCIYLSGDNGYSPQPARASVQLQVQCELKV